MRNAEAPRRAEQASEPAPSDKTLVLSALEAQALKQALFAYLNAESTNNGAPSPRTSLIEDVYARL